MTHFTSNLLHIKESMCWGAVHSPAVIHYVGGSNGVNTGPMEHWLPFLNNTNPILIPENPF